jgi:hypothetical protein
MLRQGLIPKSSEIFVKFDMYVLVLPNTGPLGPLLRGLCLVRLLSFVTHTAYVSVNNQHAHRRNSSCGTT